MESFFILGTDKRYLILADILKNQGAVHLRAPEKNESGTVIFPMRLKTEAEREILRSLPEDTPVYAGKFSEAERKIIKSSHLCAFELLENKAYLSLNSEATAEAVLCEVIKATDYLLHDLSCLIIGYGNCGKAISDILYLNGAEVFVYSHSGSMLRAEKDGYNTVDIKSRRLKMFDLIINTAEGFIFTDDILSGIARGVSVLQVATGKLQNEDKFLEYGIKPVNLPSLPAVYSPESEAMAIYQFIKLTKR